MHPDDRSPAQIAPPPLVSDAAAGYPLIDHAAALTPAWLTAVLRARGRLQAAQVIGVDCSPVGNGLMATTLRLALHLDRPEPGAPATLVVKLPSVHAARRAAGVGMRAYLKEVRFYQQVAPSLADGVSHALYADIDAQGDGFCLLFDDLAPARMGDQIAGCGLADAEAAIDVAAGLHATYWGAPQVDALTWLDREGSVTLYTQGYAAGVDTVCQRFAAGLAPAAVSAIQQLASKLDAYYQAQPRPWTITHQDFRLDNVLFEARSGAVPMAVLDWQTVRVGPGISDVAYFIGAGLETPQRRTHEAALVQRYLAALAARGVQGYAPDDAWRHYRLFAAEGLITAVIAAGMLAPSERGDRMFLTMLTRHTQHMLDLDTLSLIH